MPAPGTQGRVRVSRRQAWVPAGDHRAARRAIPGRGPRDASPREQAPRMLRLGISCLVACRTVRTPSSWSATASHPPVPQNHQEPARHGCPLCLAVRARGLARAGSDGTGAGHGLGRSKLHEHGLACATRPSPPAGPCGRIPRQPPVTKDILDGHAPYPSALALAHPAAIPAAHE